MATDLNQLRVSVLKQLIGSMQLRQFAERYNLDASYLSQILNGHRKLGEKAAANLEEKLRLPSFALIYPQTDNEPSPNPQGLASRRIPIKGVAALDSEGYWSSLKKAEGWIYISTNDPNAYALRVSGDAISPAIRDGWTVWCETHRAPIYGEYVTIDLINGRQMIKEFIYSDNETISTISTNNLNERASIPRSEVNKIHPICGIIPHHQIHY